MPDSLATRRPSAAPATVGKLPPSTTGMTLEAALELAGVSRVEFALIAATTLKQARSLEELASLIATNRRRGLDLLSRQVYFEKFDGTTPSLHVGIDGLRSTAAQTGAYAGSSDPVYRGTFEMLLEDGKTKRAVPAQCLVTVWRLVQGQKCAFEATAFMAEQYPGSGPRGRMFRQWPHRMLATAAERLALRKGFPVELQGLGDHEPEVDLEADPPPARTSVTAGMSTAERSALHDQLYREPDELPAPAYVPIRDRDVDDAPRIEPARQRYYAMLNDAIKQALIENPKAWAQRGRGATLADVLEAERELTLTIAQAQGATDPEQSAAGEASTPPSRRSTRPELAEQPRESMPDSRRVTVRSVLGQQLANLIEEAARLEVPFDDCKVELPADEDQVVRAIGRLQDRIQDKKDHLAGLVEVEADAEPQEALI